MRHVFMGCSPIFYNFADLFMLFVSFVIDHVVRCGRAAFV